jgi:hypothetical protein
MTVEVGEVNADGIAYVDLADSISPISNKGQLYIVTINDTSYRCNSWVWQGEARIGNSQLWDSIDPSYSAHPEDVPFLIDYFR